MKRIICFLMIFSIVFGGFAVSASNATLPTVPGSVFATATTPKDSIKLGWNAVNGATGYVVYYSVTRVGGYARLKVTKATSYITPNKLLFYKVRAYKSVNGRNIYGKPSQAFATSEIPVTGMTSKMYGATILRAWEVSEGSTGTTVRVEKLSYGSPITTTHYNNKYGVDKSYNITQVCYLAIVTCQPGDFGSASALKTLNKTGLKDDEGLVDDIAKAKGAIVAINNEGYDGHWNFNVPSSYIGTGPVVKDGMIVQNKGYERYCSTIYWDGSWVQYEKINQSNVNSRINAGLSFTQQSAIVIWDSKRLITLGPEIDLVGITNGLRSKVMFAQIDSTHYLMTVGEFMQSDTMIDILLAYGAKNAFSSNGGNCTYMYLRGCGNISGTIAPQLVNLNKMNVLEQEWLGLGNYIHGGKGAACPAVDIVYAK